MTVPLALSMVLLLKNVEVPFRFRGSPSVTVGTVARELSKRRSNCAPVIGVPGVTGMVWVKGVTGIIWLEEGEKCRCEDFNLSVE